MILSCYIYATLLIDMKLIKDELTYLARDLLDNIPYTRYYYPTIDIDSIMRYQRNLLRGLHDFPY